jgi:L-amino acid N-acyltransferase YncA
MVTEGSRPATSADLDRLAELIDDARRELTPTRGGALWAGRDASPPPHRPRLEALLDRVAAGSAIVTCGTLDDHVVGLAIAVTESLRDGSTLAVVEELYVEAGARAVGVGEAMMHALLAWAETAGCQGIDASVLPGNRAAKNFFERFGLTARAITVYRALP